MLGDEVGLLDWQSRELPRSEERFAAMGWKLNIEKCDEAHPKRLTGYIPTPEQFEEARRRLRVERRAAAARTASKTIRLFKAFDLVRHSLH